VNKKTVRIGIFSTAIISVLLFILYLPVLIWSPPWGKDGYYTERNRLDLPYIYKKGNHVRLYLIPGIPLGGPDLQPRPESDFKFRKKFLTFILYDGAATDLIKQTNPFTLWYIKFLEWTN
jgi:hypothetical protein